MKRWLFIFVIILALLLGSCAPEPPTEEAAPAEAEEAAQRRVDCGPPPSRVADLLNRPIQKGHPQGHQTAA